MNRVSLLESPRNRTRSAKSRDQRHLLRRRSLGIELLEDRRVLSVVFSEGFEAGWGDWTASADVWQVGTPTSGPSSAYGGSSVAGTVLSGSYAANTSSRLISPALDLPMVGDGERLELRFQQWYAYASGDYGEVQISVGSESQWSEWETLARPAPTPERRPATRQRWPTNRPNRPQTPAAKSRREPLATNPPRRRTNPNSPWQNSPDA